MSRNTRFFSLICLMLVTFSSNAFAHRNERVRTLRRESVIDTKPLKIGRCVRGHHIAPAHSHYIFAVTEKVTLETYNVSAKEERIDRDGWMITEENPVPGSSKTLVKTQTRAVENNGSLTACREMRQKYLGELRR